MRILVRIDLFTKSSVVIHKIFIYEIKRDYICHKFPQSVPDFISRSMEEGKPWKQVNKGRAHTNLNTGFRKTNHGRDTER